MSQGINILSASKLLSAIRYASEVESMVRSGEVDLRRLAKLLSRLGIKVDAEKLEEIKRKYEETKDETIVIEEVAKLLGLPSDMLTAAIETYRYLLASE
jgi:L-fucose isomerase-like protein